MRDGDSPGLFRLSAASLTLLLARRKIITLPRVMINSRRVMINPWRHRFYIDSAQPTRRVRTLPDHAPQHTRLRVSARPEPHRDPVVQRRQDLRDRKAPATSALSSMPSLAKIWLT